MIKRITEFINAIFIVSRYGSDVLFRDPLTNLYNRTFFRETAKREIERAKRYRRPLTFAFLDVDGLKTINDTLGHEAGDKALKKIAQAFFDNCRKTDIPVRWGGDEFLLLLPETNEEDASRLIIRILKQTGEIQLSYGLASWKNDDTSLDDFIANVDKKMYESKMAKKG